MSLRPRILLAGGLSALLLAVAVVYVVVAGHRGSVPAVAATRVDASPGDRILFRSTAPGSAGRIATVAADHASGPRTASAVACNRVYAAAGSVICLRPDGPLATYQLAVLDPHLKDLQTYPLVGVPNRARVSPSGRWLAWTVFVTGDSYNGGRFSTRVGMLNTVTGRTVDTLETFAVTVDGKPYRAADLNFWGVTFAGDDVFDDQAAWLGNAEVMYAVRRGTRASDVWSVPADGSGSPSLLIPDAESPADLR
jgi:hypothetical protein